MAKSKINIAQGVKNQFNAAGRIVRELAAFTPAQRARVMELVNEHRFDDAPTSAEVRTIPLDFDQAPASAE